MVTIAVLLAGCVASRPEPLPVPDALWHCPERPPIPAGLPKVRTPEQLGQYGTRVELAREAERRRGDECAGDLDAVREIARTNGWVK